MNTVYVVIVVFAAVIISLAAGFFATKVIYDRLLEEIIIDKNSIIKMLKAQKEAMESDSFCERVNTH